MATITSVTIGDERSTRDITKSFLRDQVRGSTVDVVSGSSLIPAFETTPITRLDDVETQAIKESAIKECGNANDIRCIDSTTQRLTQAKLADKQNEARSSINTIKGRRMTVNYSDKDGNHTILVPDGQTFHLDNVQKEGGAMSSLALPTVSGTTAQIFRILGIIVGSFLYAFSIAATYKTLTVNWSRYAGIAGTVASVLFPFSGFFIMFGYFLVIEVNKYPTDDITAKIMAWVTVAVVAFLYTTFAAFFGTLVAVGSMFSSPSKT
jgi:hypothetical protein